MSADYTLCGLYGGDEVVEVDMESIRVRSTSIEQVEGGVDCGPS